MITARSCDGHSSLRESFGICEFYPGEFSSEKKILFENALKKTAGIFIHQYDAENHLFLFVPKTGLLLRT